jgi:hypothetical protein
VGRYLIRRRLTVSVAPGHRLHTKEHTVSTISDPLFVRAEVDYRLERLGGTAFRPQTEAWPDLPSRLRHWLWDRRSRRSSHHRAIATQRPLHP